MAATGTDGVAPRMSTGSTQGQGPVATVIDPSVADAPVTSTQGQIAAPAPQPKQPSSARAGLNLIRRVADSLGGRSSDAGTAPAKPPFKGDSIDGDGSPDDDTLQIPAFLRRQAN